MSSCPLLEYLVMQMCYRLRTNKVNNNDINKNLKRFESPHNSWDHGDCSIEIDYVKVDVCPNWFNKPNLYFTNLKSLHLMNMCLWAIKSFDSSKFPSLEDLTLEDCYGFEEFKLSSCSIKRLTIIYPGEVIKATIDAPNILYFKYKGVYLQSSFFFTTTSHEWESYIHLCAFLAHLDDRGCSPSWLYGIDELVKGFRQSKISMHISESFKDRNMEEIVLLDISSFEQLAVVEKLTIDNATSMCLRDITQCLFRIIRPAYIVERVYKYDDEDIRQHIEFLRKKVVAWRESGTHFWQQDLEDVIMEGARPMLPENQHYYPKQVEIGFRLKWRETEMSPNSNI
ncbi:hypothetical protein CASFOL_013012 [Castilleja foliolosa]|uniref:Uncharacterized protein n=1 Tax=Castilleja foliolosa TaxID=1961234 RepID=A0ABD3DM02_9LAMI